MSTLDALLHVFEVDPFTGFMAPHPPPTRLPAAWETWEATLDAAIHARIQLGDKPGLTDEERATSHAWRLSVVAMPILPIPAELQDPPLAGSLKPLLRRTHLVLTYLQHFYIHSLPPDDPPRIPRSISVPLLRVSGALKIPPLLTYSDTVLYNWRVDDDPAPPSSSLSSSYLATTPTPPTPPNPTLIRSQTTFTSTPDEHAFYLCSAHIELCGAQALDVMRGILDEIFVGDALAVHRIARSLAALARIVDEMRTRLDEVRAGCDPDRYFGDVRPWFNGQDVDRYGRRWVFEGEGEGEGGVEMEELSGPSAGQSSIVHVLDVFLGVDHESRAVQDGGRSFMCRMKAYMPYQHRLFIDHLAAYPRPLRAFVAVRAQGEGGEELKAAYNEAVGALKRFRDAHMVIAALYILGPARRAREKEKEQEKEKGRGERMAQKGTGGTELVGFLKETRRRTMDTVIP
ncbi:hypothetical protein APHAL10511_008105 [Amanita phalloides]|nr:hypothetical protein APHAL10511_008105 [Amanita phalloides]